MEAPHEEGVVGPARPDELEGLARLLDEYRQFYRQEPDLEACCSFLRARFANADSLILVCRVEGDIAGFAQLFPTFSSVQLARTMILNDLYVGERHRSAGLGSRLLEAAARAASETGARQLVLSTGVDNHPAQRLYTAHGWVMDTDFLTFVLRLEPR